MALYDFRSIYLPYCLKRLSNGRYVVLNREYKPLGFNTHEHLNYEDYPIAAKIKGITKKLASEISIDGSSSLDEIFLYNDKTNPSSNSKNLKEYLKKIERLTKLKAE